MSLPGSDVTPYRNPCDGTILCWMGAKWQNAKHTDANVALYELSMQLPNWDGWPTGSPAIITPFEKPATVNTAPDSCETGFCSTQFGGTSPPCESWIGIDEQQYTLVASQINTAPAETPASGYTQPTEIISATVSAGGTGYVVGDTLGVPGGTLTTDGVSGELKVTSVSGSGAITGVRIFVAGLYFSNPSSVVTPTGGTGTGASISLGFGAATTDFSVCQKTGWKSVQARRCWHGRYGFGPVTGSIGSEGCSNTYSSCDDTVSVYEAYEPAPPQTKYLSENRTSSSTYSIAYTYQSNDPSTGDPISISSTLNWAFNFSQTLNVNAQSGVITLSDYIYQGGEGTWTTSVTDLSTGSSLGNWSGICYESGGIVYAQSPGPYDSPATGDSSEGGQVWQFVFQWQNFVYEFEVCGGFVAGGIPSFISSSGVYTNAQFQAAIDSFYSSYNAESVSNGHTGSTSASVTFSDTSASVVVTGSWGLTAPIPDAYSVYNESMILTGSITLSNTNTAAQVYADVVTLLDEWNLTDDKLYPWRTDGFQSTSPLVSRLETSPRSPDQTLITSGALTTVNDMRSPETDSYGNAPFSSGWTPTYAQMDWFDQTAFLWHYPAGYNSSNHAADALVQMFDGSIQGAPNPAGYENYFRFDWTDYQACLFNDGSDPPFWDFYAYGYGMLLNTYNMNVGSQIPKNATNWPDNKTAINKPPYAWMFYGDPTQIFNGVYSTGADDLAMFACKYAEIKESWPSMNAARPAGTDKFLIDETKVYGVTNISGSGAGSTWTLVDYAGNTPASLTLTGDWGGAATKGFYSGCSYSGGTVTLGTLVYNAPSNWASNSGDTSVAFGPLRWPTAPALLGRILVSVDSTGKRFTFSTGQPQFSMAVSGQEQIDIYDHGMNSIATNVTAQRIVTKWQASHSYTAGQLIVDSNNNVQEVTIGGSSGGSTPTWTETTTTDNTVTWNFIASADSFFTTTTAYPTAFWIVSHGASAWYMDDEFEKGDFVTLQDVVDYRTNLEYTRLTGILDCTGTQVSRPTQNNGYASFSQTSHCLPFQTCTPRVICFSPNAESFINGITINFPASFTMDERYTSRWQGVVQQIMDDPLWQTPHRPIGRQNSEDEPITWQMAYMCDEDTTETAYYQHVPQIEAIIALPSNYGAGKNETPPDPFSVYENLAWLSPVTNAGGPGVYAPPTYCGFETDGLPAPIVTSGMLHATYVNALAPATDCRFDYSNQVIV